MRWAILILLPTTTSYTNTSVLYTMIQLIKVMGLIPEVTFKAEHFNSTTRTITLNLDEYTDLDYLLRKYRLENIDNIPEINLIGRQKMLFTSPTRSYGGINYKNIDNNLHLKLIIK